MSFFKVCDAYERVHGRGQMDVMLDFKPNMPLQDKLNQIKALPGVQTKLQAGVELGLQIAEDTLNDIS